MVVTVSLQGSGVASLVMQDRATRNGFSPELISELLAAFDALGANPRCKVIVLTGYDTYFASGGTRSSLLTLQTGSASFADTRLYSLPLDCPVPVVAAMQGHGIGGGFVFGLSADLVVLSRESVYTTNFMDYGFTPGMGATCIVTARLGLLLAQEMLLTGRRYRGADLEKRGAGVVVLPRPEVLPHAMELAAALADKPRAALTTLKTCLTDPLRAQLPDCIARERAMHEETMHTAEVRDRITSRFGR